MLSYKRILNSPNLLSRFPIKSVFIYFVALRMNELVTYGISYPRGNLCPETLKAEKLCPFGYSFFGNGPI
jgi:hypothetical protein